MGKPTKEQFLELVKSVAEGSKMDELVTHIEAVGFNANLKDDIQNSLNGDTLTLGLEDALSTTYGCEVIFSDKQEGFGSVEDLFEWVEITGLESGVA